MTCGFPRRLTVFCAVSVAVKWMAPSCHTGTHGVTCGRPSARTVESQNSSAVSSTRRVSSHGVTPPRGTPCRVSSFVMGSFILRTPFNRSVSLARRARRYQSILFARRKTGKAKNDAMPPKVRMVAPDGKQVFEPSHHGHPWAKKWANLQPMYHPLLCLSASIKGKRYPLALLLTLLLLGKMAGETKLEGIIDWINERQQEIKKLLNWPKGFPVSKTYIDALAKCDHHEIAKAIAQVIVKARAVEQCAEEPSRLLAQKELSEASLIQTAVDGKILRGTLKHGREDQPPVHLLSFYECESGMVLDQFVVKSKNNEESACLAILHPVLVKGRIISVDAIFSCRKWCATVHAYQGYYFIPIKENNPAVLRD